MTVTVPVIAAATLSATIWKLITWRFGMPASSYYSLIGGLVGGVIAAAALAAGTFVGGMRIIRTIGGKFYKIRPIHGFTA